MVLLNEVKIMTSEELTKIILARPQKSPKDAKKVPSGGQRQEAETASDLLLQRVNDSCTLSDDGSRGQANSINSRRR